MTWIVCRITKLVGAEPISPRLSSVQEPVTHVRYVQTVGNVDVGICPPLVLGQRLCELDERLQEDNESGQPLLTVHDMEELVRVIFNQPELFITSFDICYRNLLQRENAGVVRTVVGKVYEVLPKILELLRLPSVATLVIRYSQQLLLKNRVESLWLIH